MKTSLEVIPKKIVSLKRIAVGSFPIVAIGASAGGLELYQRYSVTLPLIQAWLIFLYSTLVPITKVY